MQICNCHCTINIHNNFAIGTVYLGVYELSVFFFFYVATNFLFFIKEFAFFQLKQLLKQFRRLQTSQQWNMYFVEHYWWRSIVFMIQSNVYVHICYMYSIHINKCSRAWAVTFYTTLVVCVSVKLCTLINIFNASK